MIPTVGRLVYYKSYGTPGGEFLSVDRAAIITQVHSEESVDLCVVNPGGLFFNISVQRGDKPGQWDWMPFQKERHERYYAAASETNEETVIQ